MKGTSAKNQPRSQQALRNYQLSSLGSNNNVKSIIASMNGSGEGRGQETTQVTTVDKKKHVATRLRDKSDVPKSIDSSRRATAAEEDMPGIGTRKKDLLTVKSAAPSVVNVKPDSSGLDGYNGECAVKNGNVMESQGSVGGNSHKVDKNAVNRTKGKGHGQCPSSSDDEDDNDDDESEMSSAEESSEELDTSSSSSSSSNDDKGTNGGLEPISEERSLRIDLPDSGSSKRNKARQDKIAEDYAVEQDEEEDDDDGNCKPVIDLTNHNETILATLLHLPLYVGGRWVMENINFALVLTFVDSIDVMRWIVGYKMGW